MTFDDLLMVCRDTVAGPELESARYWHARSLVLAKTVTDMLGEAQPCTLEAPVADPGNRIVAIMDGPEPLYEFDPGEARAYAAMLLRAADAAEAGQ